VNGRPSLIAIDGANGGAIVSAALRKAGGNGAAGSVSRWDASGLFEQLAAGRGDILMASPRLLLLLYAADLAFRLRWEIEPALAEGRLVVAAPYVDTAVAFGRACRLAEPWLKELFRFARRPSERHVVRTRPHTGDAAAGFIEFGCAQVEPEHRRALAVRAHAHLAVTRRLSTGRRLDRSR
jgi:hypothetical protein